MKAHRTVLLAGVLGASGLILMACSDQDLMEGPTIPQSRGQIRVGWDPGGPSYSAAGASVGVPSGGHGAGEVDTNPGTLGSGGISSGTPAGLSGIPRTQPKR